MLRLMASMGVVKTHMESIIQFWHNIIPENIDLETLLASDPILTMLMG